jgi:hypothetical protein
MLLYAVTTALSAFLLFLVQPIIAKQILPWFGGSAGVWTTCMVFFQAALLAGYVYSDLLARRLSVRSQAIVHSALLAASLASLPIAPSTLWRPHDAANPAGRILLLLLATVGLPYFALSTTGPLVQSWLARRARAGNVYRLYAVSNVASLAALAAYPFILEPRLGGRAQSLGWSGGYAAFAALAAATAWVTVRSARAAPAISHGRAVDPLPSAPPWRRHALWFLLAMLGSALLLGVTNHITQDVAPIPLLWLLPLSIYLVTFILCFDGDGWYRRSWFVPVAALLSVLMLGGLGFAVTERWSLEAGALHLKYAVPLYAAGLFALCMFCHGELAARRPEPAHLTRFYLMVSLGGAAGGLLVGVVAPLAFPAYLELPLSVLAVALLLCVAVRGKLRLVGAGALLACAALAAVHLVALRADAVAMWRNFYGTLTIRRTAPDSDEDAAWSLVHGVTEHGTQYRRADRRRRPTSYYTEASGIGRLLTALRPGNLRVGVIGMGVGTLAAYGRPGDVFRFYELNPKVVEIARSWFTFVGDSPAAVEVVEGDGRLSLEREAPQQYDVLALDAFSSDAIPVHLLTREALRQYLRHVKAHGVLAFHVSNRYLDLAQVVEQLAGEAGLRTTRVVHEPEDEDEGADRSDWVLASDGARVLDGLGTAGAGARERRSRGSVWSDDRNDLLQVLSFRPGAGS